ncbi:MAG: chemotaxis protein CheD [Acidibacillus sp.]|nr:chemotaxis protein CheD [Acidibacillus sp.]
MIHNVGMADAKVAKGDDTLRTLGLGSCVGLVLFDPSSQVAGLAHIMLPTSHGTTEDRFKYADTAVETLLGQLIEQGANRDHVRAKLAGGAQMFAFSTGMDLVRIGPRNVEAIIAQLVLLHIPIVGSDVGGHVGRTIQVQCDSGQIWIKTVQQGDRFI